MKTLGMLAAVSALFSLVGCADLIGLQKRDALPGVLDEETGIVTTAQCVDYCDVVMEACEAEHAVYTTRSTCLGACGGLTPGDPDEPGGNTVACRNRQAQNAASQEAPSEFCPSAGPAGGDACGDDCEAYCQLLEGACPEDFDTLSDCEGACAGLTDGGPFNVEDYYTGDTLQCRLIHLSAAFADPAVHCEHGKFLATSNCISEASGSGDPDCGNFCRNVASACPGELSTYESQSQCMATCAEWPLGEIDDRDALTVGCREYHSGAALADPEVHCRHTGPGGDGVCTETASEGNCEGYCFLLEAACEDAFAEVGGTQEACQAACLSDFEEDGAASGSNYSVDIALEGGLQCRMLMLSRALDGTDLACEHVLAADACPEP